MHLLCQTRVQELEGKLVKASMSTVASLEENGDDDSISEPDDVNTAESERSTASQ